MMKKMTRKFDVIESTREMERDDWLCQDVDWSIFKIWSINLLYLLGGLRA